MAALEGSMPIGDFEFTFTCPLGQGDMSATSSGEPRQAHQPSVHTTPAQPRTSPANTDMLSYGPLAALKRAFSSSSPAPSSPPTPSPMQPVLAAPVMPTAPPSTSSTSAMDRALAIPEVVENILLQVGDSVQDTSARAPRLALYPLQRVCRTWQHALQSSKDLRDRMTLPTALIKQTKWRSQMPDIILCQLIHDFGWKIDKAWHHARETGDTTGSWRRIKINANDDRSKYGFIAVVRHDFGIDAPHATAVVDGMTLGDLFDHVEPLFEYWQRMKQEMNTRRAWFAQQQREQEEQARLAQQQQQRATGRRRTPLGEIAPADVPMPDAGGPFSIGSLTGATAEKYLEDLRHEGEDDMEGMMGAHLR